ncbi:MAG: gephyrin-like molybdotransferase Glp [Chloroflexota bacterium]
MTSVEEAQERVLSHISTLPAEAQPLLNSAGQVLAEDVYSGINIPPLDNSAMDGYAVRAADTSGASPMSPRLLRVIDTVMAGAISRRRVTPGTAIRIMTGAPLPPGADSVVAFEETDEDQRPGPSDETGVLAEVKAGLNVRYAGEDVATGTRVIRRGTVLRPSHIGVLASLGRHTVPVIRRPVVAVLATGDELVDIRRPLPPGKIYNSNTYSVAALVRRYGGIPRLLGIARDTEKSLMTKLRQGRDADMLVTTGGVSMGDYDKVKDVMAKEGELVFWKVHMKPGKPLAFGMITGDGTTIPLLGLAGNPVSSMVGFELFVRPAMLKMMGKTNLGKPTVTARLEETITNRDGRRVFARVIVERRDGQYFARLTGPQGSGILTSMTLANGLAVVPEDRARVEKGESVQVMMLDWDEED